MHLLAEAAPRLKGRIAVAIRVALKSSTTEEKLNPSPHRTVPSPSQPSHLRVKLEGQVVVGTRIVCPNNLGLGGHLEEQREATPLFSPG